MPRALGICYYPEHWPEEIWAEDARRMADLGIKWVRIGEFAWSRLEPTPGDLQFDWLARAIDTLRAEGLKIVLGTPTATPPRWMLTRHPDMLAWDAQGRPRGFGSRRHYCFSHIRYRAEAARIARHLAARFPDVDAWQTDNEYGCHDTTISYSPAARAGFRDWLAQKYQSTDALNRAWGNVFWSMEYDSFDQIDLPNLTVTEPNPAHALAFRRYTSDQVAAFNAAQVAAIRAHSDAPISHNYMGRITDFDHHTLGEQMEIATWDSYPMGFLEDRVGANPLHQREYSRQGDPDFQAFHHDLYRGLGTGRWWVMEQQPGPVNWAPSNPAPLPGMVRLWAWEAFAHGAEVVSYFRWRQAPFAQEQQHAGLLRPDNSEAPGFAEAARVAREIAARPDVPTGPSPVALIFDYPSQWAWEVQPQGTGFDYFQLVFDLYRALRKLGQSIDILPASTADLSPYKAVFVPGLLTLGQPLKGALARTEAQVLTGPRTDLKSSELSTKLPLGPDLPGLDVTVTEVETLRPDQPRGKVQLWLEHTETTGQIKQTCDGHPLLVRNDTQWHLTGWPTEAAAPDLLRPILHTAGLTTQDMPKGLRLRQAGHTRYLINYSNEPLIFDGIEIGPADLHID